MTLFILQEILKRINSQKSSPVLVMMLSRVQEMPDSKIEIEKLKG